MEENRVFEYEEGFSLCLRVRERLQDLYEGYLDAMVAETIRAHLNSCFQCNQEYRDLEQTIRLIETLPYAEPVKDFTPAIMTAIRGQSGYSFQAPVVEVETESIVSLPQSITGIESRQKSNPGFLEDLTGTEQFLDYGVRNLPALSLSIKERAAGVFALVAIFLALLFGPLFPESVLAGGYASMERSASQIPLMGIVIPFVSSLIGMIAGSTAAFLAFLTELPVPIVSLGGAFIVTLLFSRATRRREASLFAGR